MPQTDYHIGDIITVDHESLRLLYPTEHWWMLEDKMFRVRDIGLGAVSVREMGSRDSGMSIPRKYEDLFYVLRRAR